MNKNLIRNKVIIEARLFEMIADINKKVKENENEDNKEEISNLKNILDDITVNSKSLLDSIIEINEKVSKLIEIKSEEIEPIVNVEESPLESNEESMQIENNVEQTEIQEEQKEEIHQDENISVVQQQEPQNTVEMLEVRKDNNIPPKAIIVSSIQGQKLRNSRQTQEGLINIEINTLEQELIDNNLLEPTPQEKLEEMMQKANELYQSGQIEDAKKMYDEISVINQQLKNNVMAA